MKKVAIYLSACIAAASCANDEYLSDSNRIQQSENPYKIALGAGTNKITRATSGLETVTGTFKVYGTKGDKNLQVFNNYAVWHQQQAGQTVTDAYYWEYVGKNGSSQTPYIGDESGVLTATTPITLDREQQEKYWDYEQGYYRFWAVAPWDNTVTFYSKDGTNPEQITAKNTNGIVTKAELTNIGGHLNANDGTPAIYETYYIADPLKVMKTDYNEKVNFNYRRAEARVRVGIYETVPGYEITDITFYQTRISKTGKVLKVDNGGSVTGRKNIVLNRTDKAFIGNIIPGTPATGYVKYDNDNLTYSISYDESTVLSQKYFEAGKLASGVPATSSSSADLWGTDADMDASSHYFSVLPTPTANGNYGAPYTDESKPIYLCCDFTLRSTDGNSQEEIHVKGATAVVPASYTTWLPNHAYTYLFKITRNTNGSTGVTDPTGPVGPEDPSNPDPENPDPSNPDPNSPDDPTPDPNSPEGLFTITFDAMVEDYVDDALEGTTTTLTTPSITTYQNGKDIVDDGIIYKAGEDITFKVMNGTSDVTSSYKVYVSQCLSAYSHNKTAEQNGATFTLNTSGTIAAPTAGWYVIKAQDAETSPTVVTYKIVRVGAADN